VTVVTTGDPNSPSAVALALEKIAHDLRAQLDTLDGYDRGTMGLPFLPPGSTNELVRLRGNSVKNLVKLVLDSFAQNLSVTGFRSGDSTDDLPAWTGLWQPNRLDALQGVVHRTSLKFGLAYVVVLPGVPVPLIRPVSPRRMTAVYDNPMADEWPLFALEEWEQWSATGLSKWARLYTSDEVVLFTRTGESTLTAVSAQTHGVGVCPVVRFVNDMDDDGNVVSEVTALMPLQRAVNETEFNAAVIEKFGAFPQRYAIGWRAESDAQALEASVKRLWTFEDQNVKVGELTAAALAPYMARQRDTMQHAAMLAQIPPQQLIGDMTNLSADALAAAEAAQQRKLGLKRESLGESWEQVLRLAAELAGVGGVDESAEVVWKDTETRSYAAVADGIAKLARGGVPIAELVEDIPGMTQQRVERMQAAIAAQSEMELRKAATAQVNMDAALSNVAVPPGTLPPPAGPPPADNVG